LYYFTSDNFKDNNRLIDCINNKKIDVLQLSLDIDTNMNIKLDDYFLKEYQKTDIFNLIKSLHDKKYNNYFILYRKYVQKREIYEYITVNMYNSNDMPLVLKNSKNFNKLVKNNINLMKT